MGLHDFSHYQDVVLRDGGLAKEIWGRVLWIVHGNCAKADTIEDACRADFPGYDRRGFGFVCRLYGSERTLAEVTDGLAPLEHYDFIGIQPRQPVPEDTDQWAVMYRAKVRGPARERRHQKRAAARALRNGEPIPEMKDPAPSSKVQRRTPAHAVSMLSMSDGNQEFPLLLTREVIDRKSEADVLAVVPRSGTNYGIGIPVPLIPSSTPQES